MKTTMPEPVAWWLYSAILKCSVLTAKKPSEAPKNVAVVPLITTDQAEAYMQAKVREALEALNNQAQELYESSLKARLTRDGAVDEDELKAIDLWNVESVGMAKAYTNMQKAIRALIPK